MRSTDVHILYNSLTKLMIRLTRRSRAEAVGVFLSWLVHLFGLNLAVVEYDEGVGNDFLPPKKCPFLARGTLDDLPWQKYMHANHLLLRPTTP